jgi:uncharacterized protein YaaR (DUF327 family)
MACRIAKVSPLKVVRKKEEGLGPSGTGEYLRTRIPQREGGAVSFDSLLSDMEIRVLMERLEQTTRRLTLFPAETIFEEYKLIVSECLRRVLSSMKVRKDLRWRKADKNLLVTISKTEGALAELETIIQREGDRTRALRVMEEIKGCLLSLLL